jgi:autotransporter-associated beta strand protein
MPTTRSRANKAFFTVLLGLSGIAAWWASPQTALGQATAVSVSGSYGQNFDSMPNSASAALPNGWSFFRSGTSAVQPNYSLSGSNATVVGAAAGSVGSVPSTGAAYQWVTGSAASGTDKAIGFMSSGSYPGTTSTAPGQSLAILFGFTNTTGGLITNLDLTWDYEKYVSKNRAMEWQFFSSTDGVSWSANTLGNQAYVADSGTALVNPPTVASKTLSLAGVNVANGTNFYLRWSYVATGSWSNAQGLGFDNFTMNPTVSGGGSTDLYWDGGSWNATAPGTGGIGSWEDASGGWDATKKANFGGTAGTVTVGTVTASNGLSFTSSGYTLSGGTISLGGAVIGVNTITTGTDGTVTTTIDSTITGSAGLMKMGGGTLVLGGANTFSGGLTLSSGTLQIASDANLGTAPNAVSLNGTLRTTADINLGGGRAISGGASLDIAPSTTLTVGGSYATASTTLLNAGTLDLQGATRSVGTLTFSTAATVNAVGGISIGGITASGVTSGTAIINPAITFSSGDKTVDVGAGGTLALNGDIAGTTGRIAKTGAGTLIASGSNTTSGFRVGATGATPTDGGLLVITAAAASGTGQLQLNFGTLQATAPFTFANGLSIGGRSNGVAVIGGTNAITFSGSSNFFRGNGTSGELRLDVNNTTTLGRLGATTGSGSSTGVTLGGTGRLILAGDGTGFADTVTVGTGLTLELANANSLASATLVTTTGSIAYGVASTAVGGLSGSGNLALPTSTLTVGGNGASTTYSGQFSGSGSLVKTGTGTLTLSGNNGHSGGTTLSAGSLVAGNVNAFGTGTVTVGGGSLDLGGLAVANALATTGGAITGATAYAGTIGVGGLTAFTGTVGGTVNVASSGTLAGNGSAFTGPVLIGAGGVHAPGSSPGSQFFASGLAYDPTAALSWELWGNTASAGAAGTLYDTIAVTSGSLSIGSGALINLVFSGSGSTVDWSDPFWTTDQSWTVISATAASASTGVFTLGTIGTDQQGDQLTTVLPNASFNVSRTAGGDIVLNFIAVPEPSTLALAGLGLAALAGLAVRRRRSHRS